jgi:hypothetical protein
MRWPSSGRFVLAMVVLYLILLALIFGSLKAQTSDPATWHPCMDAVRCVVHTDSTLYQKRETATALYVLGSFAVVASNAIWQWNTDAPGDNPDTFNSAQALSHFGTAFMLTQGAIALHVKPVWAVTITSVAGCAFDETQGHLTWHEVGYNVGGAVAGALMARWLSFR